MIESAFLLIGTTVIFVVFLWNTWKHGGAFAFGESKHHFFLMFALAHSFGNVMLLGKKERDMIDR